MNKFMRANTDAQNSTASGTLPQDGLSWIMDSGVVHIAEESSVFSGPIRMGEIWRRLLSKHLLHRHDVKVRRTMVEACQYGVSMPGGAEGLVHTREPLRTPFGSTRTSASGR